MNTFKSITFVSMMLMSAAALAQVNISIPDTVQILVANGVKPHISGGLLTRKKHYNSQMASSKSFFVMNLIFNKEKITLVLKVM
ncbi:hypothetical protein P4S72_26015 [Vibrio sp. PP-XX7]